MIGLGLKTDSIRLYKRTNCRFHSLPRKKFLHLTVSDWETGMSSQSRRMHCRDDTLLYSWIVTDPDVVIKFDDAIDESMRWLTVGRSS